MAGGLVVRGDEPWGTVKRPGPMYAVAFVASAVSHNANVAYIGFASADNAEQSLYP